MTKSPPSRKDNTIPDTGHWRLGAVSAGDVHNAHTTVLLRTRAPSHTAVQPEARFLQNTS
jgi:hypothetical protein